jgi:HD-like signal output (HDOD) protein
LACALVAKKLALASLMDKDMAYTAGILHEIGRLALAILRPEEYTTLLETYAGSSATILQHERELFGFDHCDAGQHLVAEWKLPLEFEDIVRHHDWSVQSGDPWHMAGLIHMSCRIAATAGFAVFPGCEVTAYEDLLHELPFRERGFFHPDIDYLAAEIGTKINAMECL